MNTNPISDRTYYAGQALRSLLDNKDIGLQFDKNNQVVLSGVHKSWYSLVCKEVDEISNQMVIAMQEGAQKRHDEQMKKSRMKTHDKKIKEFQEIKKDKLYCPECKEYFKGDITSLKDRLYTCKCGAKLILMTLIKA